jgi:uncharacterized protein DUF6786
MSDTKRRHRDLVRTVARAGLILGLGVISASRAAPAGPGSFGDDVAYLRQHTDIIVLSDEHGAAQVALAPAWQGRVMTSTAQHDAGRSFGWINRELIASGKVQPHINVLGGEDRVWLGPEGGQFSIFFAKGAKFDLEHWFVPEALDTRPFKMVSRSRDRAVLQAHFPLANYSGTRFQVTIKREVRLLEPKAAWDQLGRPPSDKVSLVAYESNNTLVNAGSKAWTKETGLLSIWILGMFSPSPAATIVVPIKPGPESELGFKVRSDYFGAVPPERLKVTDEAIFLRADGTFRSKIGISPRRSLGKLGSYDADHQVLTIVEFNQPAGVIDYVNSLWKLQDDPYRGDALNSYNDGPPAPGAKPLGPFFEMESSSPAASLRSGGSLEHTHRTFHLTGPESALDPVARAVLGVSLNQIRAAFHSD